MGNARRFESSNRHQRNMSIHAPLTVDEKDGKASAMMLKRIEMAQVIRQSQQATSDALYQMHDVKKAPVPYESRVAAPQLKNPVPTDTHLLRSAEVVQKVGDGPPPIADGGVFASGSHGKPWATFEQSTPSIHGTTSAAAAPPTASPAGGCNGGSSMDDPDWQLTSYNEWYLQKHGFSNDVAAHMRINVHKS